MGSMKWDVRKVSKRATNELSQRHGLLFVPATRAIHIGENVFYRPLRSWSTGVYAGELLEVVGSDRSGCADPKKEGQLQKCCVPRTYTHRLYWHDDEPAYTVSAFLSYPNAMGYTGGNEYFWEVNLQDCKRFTGPKAEEKLERLILNFFRRRHAKKKGKHR
jgi:hypothetical protein